VPLSEAAASVRSTRARGALGDFRVVTEVSFSARVPAAIAGVNQIGQRLRSRCAFVKVGALPAEGVRRHDRLRAGMSIHILGTAVRSAGASSSCCTSPAFHLDPALPDATRLNVRLGKFCASFDDSSLLFAFTPSLSCRASRQKTCAASPRSG
jgi:hypothetical protein